MPRSLTQIHKEILRVAKERDVDPRSLTRSVFLKHGTDADEEFLGLPAQVSKHDLEHYGGWSKVRADAAHVGGVEPHKDTTASRGVELRNLYVRRLERKVAATAYFGEQLESAFEEIFSKNPIKLNTKKYQPKSKKSLERVMTLLWSDLHFGVDVKDYEVYKSRYSWKIAARRLAQVCVEAVNWKDSDDTSLRVVLNGDIMQGVIHLNDANIKPMTEQIWGAAAILTAAFDFLRQHFGSIEVICLPGNHDRMTYRDSGRSTTQRWDSHAHSLYLCLKQTFRADENICFTVPTTGIGVMDDLNGGVIIASHGDTEPDPKNISKKIDTEALGIKFLKMKNSIADGRDISVALFGHWHTPTIQMLTEGGWVVVNGCLIGSEPFGQNVIGEFNNQPCQVMLESVPGDPMNRIRFVKVKHADNDESLEDIIPTPKIIEAGELVV